MFCLSLIALIFFSIFKTALLLFLFNLFHKDALFILEKEIANYRHWRIFNYLNLSYNGKPSTMISSFFKKIVTSSLNILLKPKCLLWFICFILEQTASFWGELAERSEYQADCRLDQKLCRKQWEKTQAYPSCTKINTSTRSLEEWEISETWQNALTSRGFSAACFLFGVSVAYFVCCCFY